MLSHADTPKKGGGVGKGIPRKKKRKTREAKKKNRGQPTRTLQHLSQGGEPHGKEAFCHGRMVIGFDDEKKERTEWKPGKGFLP